MRISMNSCSFGACCAHACLASRQMLRWHNSATPGKGALLGAPVQNLTCLCWYKVPHASACGILDCLNMICSSGNRSKTRFRFGTSLKKTLSDKTTRYSPNRIKIGSDRKISDADTYDKRYARRKYKVSIDTLNREGRGH